MEGNSTFLHVGMTVENIDRTVAFYEKYFGFRANMIDRFPDGFFDAKPELYKLEQGNGSRIALIESPDGTVMELFQFDSMTPFAEAKWNTPGYHHICLEVDHIKERCAAMKADGIEFYFDPDYMGDPSDERYWVFLKDPDGNMIELQGT